MAAARGLGIWAIARRDLLAAFTTPLAWLVLAAWCLITGVLTMLAVDSARTLAPGVPVTTTVLGNATWFLVLLAPALSMTSFSSERQQGTMVLLHTAPLPGLSIVLGKTLAVWIQLLSLVAVSGLLVTGLAMLGQPPGGEVIAAAIGLVLATALLAATGVVISLVVDNPVASYVLTAGAVALSLLLGAIASNPAVSPLLRSAAAGVAIGQHLNDFSNGIIALADVAWFAAGTAMMVVSASLIWATQRRATGTAAERRRGGTALNGLLVLVVLGLAVAVVERFDQRVDLTADQRHSLDPALRQLISDRAGPAELTGLELIVIRDDGRLVDAIPVLDYAHTLLERLAPLVDGSVQQLDRQRDLAEIATLESRVGPVSAPEIWLLADGRPAQRVVLTRRSPITLQRELAAAVVALSGGQRPVVGLISGHGELVTDSSPSGIDGWLARLRLAGLRIAERPLDDALLAERNGRIPDDVDLVIVAGPTRDLPQTTSAALQDWWRRGGASVVLVDDRAPAGLVNALAEVGVLVGRAGNSAEAPGLIGQSVEHRLAQPGDPYSTLFLHYGAGVLDAAITDRIVVDQRPVVVPRAGVIDGELFAERAAAGGFATSQRRIALALPGSGAWVGVLSNGRPPAPPADGIGFDTDLPLALQMAYQPHPEQTDGPGARLVVIASRELATNRWVEEPSTGNGLLLVDAATWALNRAERVPVPDLQLRTWRIDASDQAMLILAAILIGLLPATCIGVAIGWWWERR